MQTVTLGRTGITVNKNGFGALPIQRVSAEYAGMLLRKAYNAGITYFDTARSYSDARRKWAWPFSGVRGNIIIATKTPCHHCGGLLAGFGDQPAPAQDRLHRCVPVS